MEAGLVMIAPPRESGCRIIPASRKWKTLLLHDFESAVTLRTDGLKLNMIWYHRLPCCNLSSCIAVTRSKRGAWFVLRVYQVCPVPSASTGAGACPASANAGTSVAPFWRPSRVALSPALHLTGTHEAGWQKAQSTNRSITIYTTHLVNWKLPGATTLPAGWQRGAVVLLASAPGARWNGRAMMSSRRHLFGSN